MKANIDAYANYPQLSLRHATLLINGIEINQKNLRLLEEVRKQFDKIGSFDLNEAEKKACEGYFHLYNVFKKIDLRKTVKGSQEFSTLSIVEKATKLGHCNDENKFVLAVKQANKLQPAKKQEKKNTTPKESTLLNMVGAFATLYWGRPQQKINQSKLITAVLERFSNVQGLSQKSLQTYLPLALESLQKEIDE